MQWALKYKKLLLKNITNVAFSVITSAQTWERVVRGKLDRASGEAGLPPKAAVRMISNGLALTIVRRPWTVVLSGVLVVLVVSCIAIFQVS